MALRARRVMARAKARAIVVYIYIVVDFMASVSSVLGPVNMR